MQAVIDSPNGQRNLSLENYQSGGKTGTAQRADTKCGCYKGYVTSFVGFAPLDDPQILTYVVVTNPRKADTGTTHGRSGLPGCDEHGPAALLGGSRRQAAQATAHGMVTGERQGPGRLSGR